MKQLCHEEGLYEAELVQGDASTNVGREIGLGDAKDGARFGIGADGVNEDDFSTVADIVNKVGAGGAAIQKFDRGR